MGLKDTPDTNPHLAARRRALFQAIARLDSIEACEIFFEDLCKSLLPPNTELCRHAGEAMAYRWAVARLLDKHKPYRRIQEETSVSTATITRVARALYHGEGGYRRMLDAMRGDGG